MHIIILTAISSSVGEPRKQIVSISPHNSRAVADLSNWLLPVLELCSRRSSSCIGWMTDFGRLWHKKVILETFIIASHRYHMPRLLSCHTDHMHGLSIDSKSAYLSRRQSSATWPHLTATLSSCLFIYMYRATSCCCGCGELLLAYSTSRHRAGMWLQRVPFLTAQPKGRM